MIISINVAIFLLLIIGCFFVTEWLWEDGVQEIIIYTENFLVEETKKIRVKALPEITSTKLLDRLELLLYYSGIRNRFPFVSAKVWLIGNAILYACTFLIMITLTGSLLKAVASCIAMGFVMTQILCWMRQQNLKAVERQLLELINVTESFAATGDEALAILQNCSSYMKGPIGQALGSIETRLERGWSGRMVLEQLKIMLEHPKWQEFIHNLNVCCIYNSDFNYVFRSSRKSIQAYLSAKKNRQSIKHTAQMEMGIIVFLGMIIVMVLGQFLSLSTYELMWGSIFGKACTIYMIGIVFLFYWKIGAYEKE